MTQLLLNTWRFWTPRKTGCLNLQEPDIKSPATTIGQGDSGRSEEVPPQNLFALSIEDWVNEWNATSILLLVPCVASQACYSVVWQFTWQNILKYFVEGFGAAVVSSGVHHQDIVNELILENLNWRFFHGLYLSKRRGFSEVNFPFKFGD